MSDLRTATPPAEGAPAGHYNGAPATPVYSSVREEFHALMTSAAVYHMPWRVWLKVTGEDRVRWLNGMVTNNIRDLTENHGAYSFVLTAQGRIQADLVAFNFGDYLLLETDAFQADKLYELLDRFIIMDDVELARVDGQAAIGLSGPRDGEVLRSLGADVSAMQPLEVRPAEIAGIPVRVVRGHRLEDFELWFNSSVADELFQAIVAVGAMPVGTGALEFYRVYRGMPRIGQDIQERHLPQETAQDHALHFAKGCYIGQEIVERIRSRGQVHRRLTGYVFESPPPAPGIKVQAAGKDVGEISSAATLPFPDGDRHVALGYVRHELVPVGTSITAGNVKGVVTALPFAENHETTKG